MADSMGAGVSSAHSEDFDDVTVGLPVTSGNTSFEAVEGVPQTAGTGVVGRIGNGVQITSGDSGGAGWSDCGLFDTGSGKRSAFRAYLRRDAAVTGDDLHFAWMVGRYPGGNVVDEVSTADVMDDLAWDGANLWGVSSRPYPSTVYKLDPSTGAVLDSFTAPDASTRGLTWDGTHVLASTSSGGPLGTIYRKDPATGSTVSTISVAGAYLRGLAWDGTNLWVVIFADGAWAIAEINPATGATVSTIPLPAGWDPRGLTWDGERLWVVDQAGGNVRRVDPAIGEITESVPVDSPVGLTRDGANLRVSTESNTVQTVTVPTVTTPLALSVTTTGTLAATGLTLDTGDATLPLGEWTRAEAELVANGTDVDVAVRLYTGIGVDSDNDTDATAVLTGTIADGTTILADASLLFGRDPDTAPTAGTLTLDDVAFDTYPPLAIAPPDTDLPGMNWWDGNYTRKADLFGWWDGATVQPVDFLGIWDGTTVQPSPE